MPAKKKGFTLKQHDQLGLEIQTIHDRLQQIQADLENHYPKKLEAVKNTAKIVEDFMKWKKELSELAMDQYKFTDHDVEPLYYRNLKGDHVSNPQPIRPFPQE